MCWLLMEMLSNPTLSFQHPVLLLSVHWYRWMRTCWMTTRYWHDFGLWTRQFTKARCKHRQKSPNTCPHVQNAHAWSHACRETHNQCSLSASLTSGGAWPARWPMHVSTSARACPWVCMCLLVWKSAVHPSEYCVFQFTSLAASLHNEAAARTRSYRKRWTVYFRYS